MGTKARVQIISKAMVINPLKNKIRPKKHGSIFWFSIPSLVLFFSILLDES